MKKIAQNWYNRLKQDQPQQQSRYLATLNADVWVGPKEKELELEDVKNAVRKATTSGEGGLIDGSLYTIRFDNDVQVRVYG